MPCCRDLDRRWSARQGACRWENKPRCAACLCGLQHPQLIICLIQSAQLPAVSQRCAFCRNDPYTRNTG